MIELDVGLGRTIKFCQVLAIIPGAQRGSQISRIGPLLKEIMLRHGLLLTVTSIDSRLKEPRLKDLNYNYSQLRKEGYSYT